ncbi:F0F1 ATP synthase subunit epsilon [Acuticoccus kandeliae]|uniref:F0F1 ATP synthase subunit epsilon n=1 Tax=Acuticoccus kandeliae TaxID=2073160 RepID=UPI000D3EAE19|nr:F0F1 ATP synthase subunit epsilon [Acuticoccus kandeliae]
MKLTIATPTKIVAEADVRSVRAEDETGSFGILDRHADFVTALTDGVVSWEAADGTTHHCAVRRGVLVTDGKTVHIATREAVLGDDLDKLASDVVAAFTHRDEVERAARTEGLKLETRAIRQIVQSLSSRPGGHAGGGR